MKPEIRPLPRICLASLCLAAMSVSGCKREERATQSSTPAAEADSPAPKSEADAYAEIAALKPRKGDADLVRLGPAFLEKYPDSPHFEKVAGLTGEALMRRKDWKGALDCYLSVAGRFPKSADIERYKLQAAVCRIELKEFKPAALELEKFLKDYPESGLKEAATYRLAMAHFHNNDYKETLLGCRAYLMAYPEGKYAGDMIYRLGIIDAHDKEVDQSDNIIAVLGKFLEENPGDGAVGSMHCLVGDTWLKKKPENPADPAAAAKQMRANEDKALDHYRQAALSPASEVEVAEYASKAAGDLLTKHGEDEALREFRGEYQKQVEARLKAEDGE